LPVAEAFGRLRVMRWNVKNSRPFSGDFLKSFFDFMEPWGI